MATSAADVLIDALCDWGVEVIFGLPGDGINGLMEALRIRQDTVRFVPVRHEEAAAFMACGYAKYTGKLGICLATSGPGGIHLVSAGGFAQASIGGRKGDFTTILDEEADDVGKKCHDQGGGIYSHNERRGVRSESWGRLRRKAKTVGGHQGDIAGSGSYARAFGEIE
jgi:hypothetical protein